MRCVIFNPINKKPYAYIEPGVKPLVDVMNATQVLQTIASCEGHAGFRWRAPYVYFSAPVEVAAGIERHLRQAPTKGKPCLKYVWSVSGSFNQDFELVYSLRSHEIDVACDSPIQSFWLCVIRRNMLNHELYLLAQELKKLDLRKTYMPDVVQGHTSTDDD